MFVEMWARVACLCVCLFVVASETVVKKLCNGVDSSSCTVYSAAVDPCSKNDDFCTLRRKKPHTLTVDFTPRFSAENVQLAMYGDDDNDGLFDKTIKTPADPCDLITCPVDADVPRMFNMQFALDKTIGKEAAKFPLKFKLWNADNETQACCFTFDVKVKK